MAEMKEQVETKLKNEIGAIHLDVQDMSDGCGAKFASLIVSPQFDGKNRVQRQKMVYAAIAEEMKSIHAFQMKTLTPEEWEKQKEAQQ